MPDAVRSAFEGAGYTRAQAIEVVLGVAIKTLTNYTNHLVGVAVNEQFMKFHPAAGQ